MRVIVMSETHPSLASMALFFVLYVILGILVIWGLTEALYQFLGYDLNTNASGLIVSFIAAMSCGTRYAEKSGDQMPASGFSWKFALISATLMITISAAITYFLVVRTGLIYEAIPNFDLNSARDQKIVGGVLAGLWVLCLLMNRVFFAFGARSTIKRKQKLAEKAAKRQQQSQ